MLRREIRREMKKGNLSSSNVKDIQKGFYEVIDTLTQDELSTMMKEMEKKGAS